MKFSKKHLMPGLIGNLIVFFLGLTGFVWFMLEPGNKLEGFLYFTLLSNVLVTVVSLINAILFAVSYKKEKNCVKEFFQVVKLASVSAVAITFTMVILFLLPKDPTYGFYEGSQLFMHAIVPVAAVLSFIFLEYAQKIRFRFFFVPAILIVIYGAFYVSYAFLAKEGTAVDWYGFMFESQNRITPVDASKFTIGTFFIFLGESLGGSILFGFVLWVLNKIINLVFIGYVLEEPAEEKIVVEELKTKANKISASKVKKASTNKKYKDGARVYHISRSKFVSRHWQVKLAGGEKAIKLFSTQLEAINYAKELTKTQGGSIRIHSMKGQLRK